MDRMRELLGVVTVLMVPLGMLYWFILHLGARWWRRWGPARTYLAVLPVIGLVGALLFAIRGRLLGSDLGTNWMLIGAAVLLCCPMTWMELRYWRHLSIPTLLGVPELSPQPAGRLLREGIYARVRHPRYVSGGLGVIANMLIVNHVGLYVLAVAIILPGYLLLLAEERELVGRFGEAYRQYQREVPQLIPRRRKSSTGAPKHKAHEQK